MGGHASDGAAAAWGGGGPRGLRGGRARCSDGGRRGVARPSREGAAPGGGAAGEGPRALQPRVSPFLYPRTNVPAGPQAHARASLFPASRCSRIHASPHPSITASLRNPTPGLKILTLPRRGAAGAADGRGGGPPSPARRAHRVRSRPAPGMRERRGVYGSAEQPRRS